MCNTVTEYFASSQLETDVKAIEELIVPTNQMQGA
jgi:hypothetical protein